jgi:hypothetical protein
LESVVVKEVHSLLHKASCEFSTWIDARK